MSCRPTAAENAVLDSQQCSGYEVGARSAFPIPDGSVRPAFLIPVAGLEVWETERLNERR